MNSQQLRRKLRDDGYSNAEIDELEKQIAEQQNDAARDRGAEEHYKQEQS